MARSLFLDFIPFRRKNKQSRKGRPIILVQIILGKVLSRLLIGALCLASMTVRQPQLR